MEKAVPTISPTLASMLRDSPRDAEFPVMVFFTDKGISTQSQFATALNLAKENLSPRAMSRRMKSRGTENVVDFRDLPVSPTRIGDILSTGARLRHILRWFNAVSVEATPDQIKKLSSLSFVRYVKPVSFARLAYELHPEPVIPDATLISLQYGPSYRQLDQINVIPAHELGFKGQGVLVCMMDTGFRQGHDAFQNIISSGRLVAQHDFINNDDDTDYDSDQDIPGQPDHGTLTWSTLGGEAATHLYGPSYLAGFVLSKTEDISSERHIEEDNWAAGAEWADSIGASVISASLGYRWFDSGQGDYDYSQLDGNSTIVTIAADLAAYNGIAVATAMGNEGNSDGSLVAPADGDSVIACGAVDSLGTLAGFSSWGPTYDGRTKPEVCAMGVRTACVDPYDIHGYRTASGTSLSTPLIGGACGVLFSAHPNWTPAMVREALMMTGDRFDSPDNAYGWGILDVSRALYFHPTSDIVIDHQPLVFVAPNQPLNVLAHIAGGAAIDSAVLSYRVGDTGEYTSIVMTSPDGITFSGDIPGQPNGTIHYFLQAFQSGGASALWPLGGPMHPFTVSPGQASFVDSFEGGIRYWTTGGDWNLWGLTARAVSTGNLSITDSPTTQYRSSANSFLESIFKLDLSQVGSANFQFQLQGSLAAADSLHVEAASDSTDWIRLGPSIAGSIPTFTQFTYDLAQLVGQPDVRVRFHLVTNGNGRDDGIFIDDVAMNLALAPNISFSPSSVADTLFQEEIQTQEFIVRNTGTADLVLSILAVELALIANQPDEIAILGVDEVFDRLNTWLFVSPASDTIAAGDSLLGQITLDASAISPGSYNGLVEIDSNDPDSPTATIPVALVVLEPQPGCQYVIGDIGGNGQSNGVDVTYGVSFFKGGAAPVIDCNPPCSGVPDPFYAAGDVNGSCSFNGIDITYFVTYLKGGPSFTPCPLCPPASSALPAPVRRVPRSADIQGREQ
jgi:hypothetical protein